MSQAIQQQQTSNGVTVDNTPAAKGNVRDGNTLTDIDYQADNKYIYANWDDFRDDESDVVSYTWCAGTRKGICDLVTETDEGDRTSVSQQVHPPLPEGIEIFVTVNALNNAEISSISFSDGFLVDSSPPVFSKVTLFNSFTVFLHGPTFILFYFFILILHEIYIQNHSRKSFRSE